jgi:hypothetical protein
MHPIPRTGATLAAAVLLLGACDDGGVEPLVPTSLRLSVTSVELEAGDSAVVTATILDQHGSRLTPAPTGYAVSWTSSATGIASVAGGVIRGLSAGTATIHAKAGTLPEAAIQVQVTPPAPAGIQLYAHTNLLQVGDSLQLHAYVYDGRNNPVEGHEAVWTSLHPDLAEVSSTGVLRGLAPGWAVIQLRAAGFATQGGFHIRPPVCTGTPVGTLALGDTVRGELGGAGACDSPFGGPWPIGAFAAAWRLDLAAPAAVRIDLNSDDFDAVLFLSDLQLTVIARDDEGSEDSDARITRELPAGSYLVWASSFFANETGRYELVVR